MNCYFIALGNRDGFEVKVRLSIGNTCVVRDVESKADVQKCVAEKQAPNSKRKSG